MMYNTLYTIFPHLNLDIIKLILILPVVKDNIYESLDNFDNRKPKPGYSTLTLRKKGKHKSSWHFSEKFSVTLCSISGLNCDVKKNTEVSRNVYITMFILNSSRFCRLAFRLDCFMEGSPFANHRKPQRNRLQKSVNVNLISMRLWTLTFRYAIFHAVPKSVLWYMKLQKALEVWRHGKWRNLPIRYKYLYKASLNLMA